MGKEFELKYPIPAQDFPARLQWLRDTYGSQVECCQMETAYYDTPKRDLVRLFWTLRCRLEVTEETAYVFTCKTPSEEGGCNEWEVSFPQNPDLYQGMEALVNQGAPQELRQLIPHLGYQCGARFTRHRVTTQAGNATVELALDQGILLGPTQELPFQELEVELKEGSAQDMIVWCQKLAETFCLEPEYLSKFARAVVLP